MPRDPSEIYHTLVEELRQSARWFRAASDNSNKLSIAGYALCKLIAFLDADPTIFREGLTAPLGLWRQPPASGPRGGGRRCSNAEWRPIGRLPMTASRRRACWRSMCRCRQRFRLRKPPVSLRTN